MNFVLLFKRLIDAHEYLGVRSDVVGEVKLGSQDLIEEEKD